MLTNRLQIAGMAEPYLGKYFSVYQVRHDLLGYTDGEIKEIDKQISYERNVGIIPDPNAQLLQQLQDRRGVWQALLTLVVTTNKCQGICHYLVTQLHKFLWVEQQVEEVPQVVLLSLHPCNTKYLKHLSYVKSCGTY